MKAQKLDNKILENGCNEVINALSKYPVPYKIAILSTLIDSFPAEYMVVSKEEFDEN